VPRGDLEFSAEDTTLRGWFYPAVTSAAQAPVVVLSQGFSAVKEMALDRYADVFAAATRGRPLRRVRRRLRAVEPAGA
jgi:hypothetical protein